MGNSNSCSNLLILVPLHTNAILSLAFLNFKQVKRHHVFANGDFVINTVTFHSFEQVANLYASVLLEIYPLTEKYITEKKDTFLVLFFHFHEKLRHIQKGIFFFSKSINLGVTKE